MKSLKLNHDFAQLVVKGKQTSTWRINDDKDLHVNEDIQLIDKVDPIDPSSWVSIGVGRITSILEKQLGSISKVDMEGAETFVSTKELLATFRGYYGAQVHLETPVKLIRFIFTPAGKETVTGAISEAKLYGDGGSRGNPGPSASGYVLYDMNDTVMVENGLFLGITTNNQAEYQSLKMGLEAALKRGITILHVYMDSMLVVNQVKGVFKVKNRDLIPVHASVMELTKKFTKITITHVPRELNRRADGIVNEVLDAIK